MYLAGTNRREKCCLNISDVRPKFGSTKLVAATLLCLLCGLASTVSSAQVFKTLAVFNKANGAANPLGSLVEGADGNFYGTTELGGIAGTVFTITPTGQLTVLATLGENEYPYGGLVLANDGNFYGTTYAGGTGNCGGGCGTVFMVTSEGSLTILNSFDSADGVEPAGTMVQGADANFYGMAFFGGAYCVPQGGCGTIFTLSGGTLSAFHSFDFQDGYLPEALVQGTDGNFYGVTNGGGTGSYCTASNGCGTIFQITPSGTLTTIYSFCSQENCSDGEGPTGLMQGTDGNLYGTTSYGGIGGNCSGGCGTLFSITFAGALTTLHNFTGTDGSFPWFSNLVLGADGNFYGTTFAGGTSSNCGGGCGTIFRVIPGGTLTSLHSFNQKAGSEPAGALVQGTDGNLYGTTYLGGSHNDGTVFRLTPAAVKTTTTLTSSPNPSADGQAVTFTAVVTPAPPDGETAAFTQGKISLGTGTLTGGTAIFVTSTLKVGTTSVTAVYGGDSNFKGSKSKPVKQVVQ